ncbi:MULTISPECIES: tyrosine-type recombinase/integrase [Bacillota]|uniref:tyrosine-type recombinase/integrase n=1 Tax=Bacillota TaxID=1239 RepID=UPI0039EFA526
MPYGFIRHIENKGYSVETVRSYEKVLNQFFAFLSKKYKKHIEPSEINPSDIKGYMKDQKEQGKSNSTINKELAILKTFFNFLWESSTVAVDPSVKIKRYKDIKNLTVGISYEEILKLRDNVLNNETYSNIRKAIFILAARGLKTSDFRFKKDDVIDNSEDETVEIKLKNRRILLQGQEADCFLEYFYETLLNGSDYVFLTKSHGEDVGEPIQVMSILTHLRNIAQDYLPEDSSPLTLILIRRAIAYDRYTNKVPIQRIAQELGIEEASASNYIKILLEGNTQKVLEGEI